MSFSEKLLTREELDRLANTIAEAEKKTSGEIKLMIVKRSSKLPDVFKVLMLFFATMLMILCWYERENWFLYSGFFYTRYLSYIGIVVLVVSAALAWIFARFEFVQRLVTRPSVLAQWVWLRAELEFHREGLGKTIDRTGILILLSVFERRAVVLADKGINEKLDKNVWQEVIDSVVDGVKKGQLADNLELAIKQCGNLLAKHFPIKPDDTNELSNTVIVKE
jgi:putative membrane protein